MLGIWQLLHALTIDTLFYMTSWSWRHFCSTIAIDNIEWILELTCICTTVINNLHSTILYRLLQMIKFLWTIAINTLLYTLLWWIFLIDPIAFDNFNFLVSPTPRTEGHTCSPNHISTIYPSFSFTQHLKLVLCLNTFSTACERPSKSAG